MITLAVERGISNAADTTTNDSSKTYPLVCSCSIAPKYIKYKPLLVKLNEIIVNTPPENVDCRCSDNTSTSSNSRCNCDRDWIIPDDLGITPEIFEDLVKIINQRGASYTIDALDDMFLIRYESNCSGP